MSLESILFWVLSFLTIGSGLAVVCITNPIYAAFALALTMIGIASLFVTLGAYFLAAVQLIVYAGAVMVLFVMVLMIFDLKKESRAFTRGAFTGFIKVACGGFLVGSIWVGIILSADLVLNEFQGIEMADTTRALSKMLFSQYLFSFEAIGVLLLIVAVGTVALARSKGGTHA